MFLSLIPAQAGIRGPFQSLGCRINDPVESARVTLPETSPGPLASAVQWSGFFGTEGPGSAVAYILLDQGFLDLIGGGPSDQFDELNVAIGAWLEAHPNARVVSVEFMPIEKNAGFTYAWLVDGAENLNLELVRTGVCPAYKMLVPDGKREWRIARAEYDRFEAAIHRAELAAVAARAGVWGRTAMQHDAHWQLAEEFERQRKFPEAIAEFKLSLRGDDYAPADAATWLRIARCHDAAGDYPAALAAFDRSVLNGGDGPRVWNYFEKAQCMAKHESLDKAVAMLEAIIAAAPDDIERYRVLAELEYVSGRFARATATLERGTARFEKRAKIRFDGAGAVIWESQRVRESTSYLEDAQTLRFGYGRLAAFYFAAGNPDQVLRICARVLSIAREIMHYPPGSHSSAEIEAGDSSCRIIRANVFLVRGSMGAVTVELDHVKTLLDSGYTQGFGVEEAYGELSAELTRRMTPAGR
jgi:tetratricopeptide (TPR) repeat protein